MKRLTSIIRPRVTIEEEGFHYEAPPRVLYKDTTNITRVAFVDAKEGYYRLFSSYSDNLNGGLL